jgi:hypothetical protein
MLIQSSCRKCKASKVVSANDESLQRWEEEHECAGATSGGRD